MRGWSKSVASLLLVGSGCTLAPIGQEIADSLERALRSVSGNWNGRASSANSLALEFLLHEDSNGKVTGTGKMKESRTGAEVPITVTGTYRRPMLSLTFIGAGYRGGQVRGTLEGKYTTVGGIATTLQLSGPGTYEKVAILLQEE